ncbi:MAG: acyl-CoA reductase [Candidatus Pseudobacter hemicellulosilyticus]|uniref:Acyl-CoA reductase n=1 Tax=Candidatus Pseudobacter hemicellulosilyticus TaxID=3121375 RepID=A0AAJ6BK40_9BACT|nr:MAG: acyl-CoA reductase [Pseudobacter sp.]
MTLEQRLDLLERLGQYLLSDNEEWLSVKQRAHRENAWFTPAFIELATTRIAEAFLQKELLTAWVARYRVPATQPSPKNIGLVMAGNIPLVGFHDLLCVFISGHRQTIKASSKDETLIKHLVHKCWEWAPETQSLIQFSTLLKGCDAYIATGSNNSARYFDYYFAKYPHIIRRNRTSAALLTGKESAEELDRLADDVHEYFGLGCRNITKLYVPQAYDFVPLLDAFNKYNYLADEHKYRNNYDYQLALLILNKQYYMTNSSVLLVEEQSLFSPISQVNYETYSDPAAVINSLQESKDLQCLAGAGLLAFGQAQLPSLTDYADGVDTLQFLLDL